MNAKLKEKWIKALRSGEYKQTTTQLYNKNENSFCCLGVLCKVAGIEINDLGTACVKNNNDDGYDPIIKLLGDVGPKEFWRRNDGIAPYKKHLFTDMANWIEKNIPSE